MKHNHRLMKITYDIIVLPALLLLKTWKCNKVRRDSLSVGLHVIPLMLIGFQFKVLGPIHASIVSDKTCQ